MRLRKWRSAAARRICRFAGATDVSAATSEVARRLLDGVQHPPTDLEAILPRVGIQSCVIDPDLLIAGELRKDSLGLYVAYSQHQSEARRRFTIAHEIGHAIFEKTGPHCPRSGVELERICDMIASKLLMPESALRAAVRLPLTLTEVMRLAGVFHTSLTATAIRCADEFHVPTFLIEYGELRWFAGTHRGFKAGFRTEMVTLGKTMTDSQGQCRVQASMPRFVRDYWLQWRTVGQAERKLFVLAESAIEPSTGADDRGGNSFDSDGCEN